MSEQQNKLTRVLMPPTPTKKPKWLVPQGAKWSGHQSECGPELILVLKVLKYHPYRLKDANHDRWGLYSKDDRLWLRRSIFVEILKNHDPDITEARIRHVLQCAANYRMIQVFEKGSPTLPIRIPGRKGTDRCICICVALDDG